MCFKVFEILSTIKTVLQQLRWVKMNHTLKAHTKTIWILHTVVFAFTYASDSNPHGVIMNGASHTSYLVLVKGVEYDMGWIMILITHNIQYTELYHMLGYVSKYTKWYSLNPASKSLIMVIMTHTQVKGFWWYHFLWSG